jgi:hypothetical protein
MTVPNLVVYSGDVLGWLGPKNTYWLFERVAESYWTTVILGMFHINRPDPPSDHPGRTIHFGNTLLIKDGLPVADLNAWQSNLTLLKQSSTIKNVYASIGGDNAVIFDFRTIQMVYEDNKNSFKGTTLEKNLTVLRKALPAINGIDMDNEECEDQESFVAFCQMVRGLGWDITFCAYGDREDHSFPPYFYFWIDSLKAVQQSTWGQGAVKWLSLQMYAPAISPIRVWVEEIKKALPDFSTDHFIVPGFAARFWWVEKNNWSGSCPSEIKKDLISFRNQSTDNRAAIGGAFIWNLEYTFEMGNLGACGIPGGMENYTSDITEAFMQD